MESVDCRRDEIFFACGRDHFLRFDVLNVAFLLDFFLHLKKINKYMQTTKQSTNADTFALAEEQRNDTDDKYI